MDTHAKINFLKKLWDEIKLIVLINVSYSYVLGICNLRFHYDISIQVLMYFGHIHPLSSSLVPSLRSFPSLANPSLPSRSSSLR